MVFVNENFLKINNDYLFSKVAKIVQCYQQKKESLDMINMGIGDVTLPLPCACVEAMIRAAKEQLNRNTFKGYGPTQGYDFLRNAILENDYIHRGLNIELDEIFVNGGIKTDISSIVGIFSTNHKIAIPNPVYPVYIDSNVIGNSAGYFKEHNNWENIIYLETNENVGFKPNIPEEKVDIIYLCSPNNPTGVALTKEELTAWVEYAQENRALILFDAAYKAYISEDNIPRSIYEIEGATSVAIEFKSYSKNAGFTGIRCGYTIIPKTVCASSKHGEKISLNKIWSQYQNIRFGGVPYIIQRGAEAVYSIEGQTQVKDMVSYYMKNSSIIRSKLGLNNITTFGGINSPFIWVKCPRSMDSWKFFYYLLEEKKIVCIPGTGFGKAGEGYIRISSFNERNQIIEGMMRFDGIT